MAGTSEVVERFKIIDSSTPINKTDVLQYLVNCMTEGKSFILKRRRVMVMEYKEKNKFLILKRIRTCDENKQVYLCPKCSPIDFNQLLTNFVDSKDFRPCLHSELCRLLWGDEMPVEIDIEDSDNEDLVEVVTEEPYYLAAVHPSNSSSKGPGVVKLTRKTCKPKCLTCQEQDSCLHLKLHNTQYKRNLDSSDHQGASKRLKIDRLDAKKPQKKIFDDSASFDPFQYNGAQANVFNVRIPFIQTKEAIKKNRDMLSFNKRNLVAKYSTSETCKHGLFFDPTESILNIESTEIVIHHISRVETSDVKILYRPTVPADKDKTCSCKKFYTGSEDNLLRVSAANHKMTNRSRSLHFVTYEYYFSYLGRLIMGGESLNSFIKSQKFTSEIFLGSEKSPEFRKVLQKGFDIFCHALEFPSDANYCFKCPQKLSVGENEDEFEDSIEYSIIDGIQMGCKVSVLKPLIIEDYFKEEVVTEPIVQGIESNDRTVVNSQKVRLILSDLLDSKSHPDAIKKSINELNNTDLNENAQTILELFYRLLKEDDIVPEGYIPLLKELKLETPISALMVPYSSNRTVYQTFMDFLNNKTDLFALPSSVESFVNNFPVIGKGSKHINFS